jgi:hypothetical protein
LTNEQDEYQESVFDFAGAHRRDDGGRAKDNSPLVLTSKDAGR